MYFKNSTTAAHLLAAVIMVAPATAYTNLNANSSIGLYSPNITQKTAQKTTVGSVWFSEFRTNRNTHALLNTIADAELHGLNPITYGSDSLEQELKTYVTNSEKLGSYTSESNSDERKSLESKLFSAFKQFAQDMGQGVLDAQATQRNLYRAAPTVDTDELLARLNSGEATVNELLTELTPSSPHYLKLVDHMHSLLEQRDAGKGRTTVSLGEGVILESEHPSVIDLRSRLMETGDLDPAGSLTIYFGSDVEEALKAFQARHGITATGELNEATVVALNKTIDNEIEEVAMNLERWRWMPRELGDRHIMVNIPSYNLSMMNGDQQIVDMAVVVGSKKHQTPVFSKGAQFVEVAPTWTVPASITNNELLPIERKRPGYLDSERMDYFKWVEGRLVSVPRSQITAADFEKRPFPYVLRQRAGADNALGKIKILMPNKYAIYMHDTQAKDLFAKTDRAYSHGCIRLSDPFRLGSLLLQLDGKSPTETDEILAKTKTTRVKLNEKTPTHISYFTAWVDEEGQLNQRKDVYKHNKKLIAGLKANNTLLSTLKSRPVAVLAEQGEL